MTPSAILEQAFDDGVSMILTPTGSLKMRGEGAAVNRWLPFIREHKAEVVDLLRREMRPTKAEAEAELQRLVREVAAFHVFTPHEEAEALRNALADFDAALGCFRALRGEISK